MKMTIEFKQTPEGHIAFHYEVTGTDAATPLEKAHMGCFKKLVTEGIPVIAQHLGAKGTVILGCGRPQNQ